MSTFLLITFCLLIAVAIGQWIGRRIPTGHQNSETRDAVKLSMGLVATMSALLLGLLVSSSKASYDAAKNNVVTISAKVDFLDRVLELHGPESAGVRASLREARRRMADSLVSGSDALPASNVQSGNELYLAVRELPAKDERQKELRTMAERLVVELGEVRTFMHAQSQARTPQVLLVVVVAWLFMVFASFSVLAPPNTTARVALMVSVISAAGALYLVLELDRPFEGLIDVRLEPLREGLRAEGG